MSWTDLIWRWLCSLSIPLKDRCNHVRARTYTCKRYKHIQRLFKYYSRQSLWVYNNSFSSCRVACEHMYMYATWSRRDISIRPHISRIPRENGFPPRDARKAKFTNHANINIFRVLRALEGRWETRSTHPYEFLKCEWNLWDVRYFHNVAYINTVRMHETLSTARKIYREREEDRGSRSKSSISR